MKTTLGLKDTAGRGEVGQQAQKKHNNGVREREKRNEQHEKEMMRLYSTGAESPITIITKKTKRLHVCISPSVKRHEFHIPHFHHHTLIDREIDR